MAGDTLRVIMDIGKFHGVMAPTTPTGCLITTGRLLPETVCSTSPFTLLHSSANHSIDATLHTYTLTHQLANLDDISVPYTLSAPQRHDLTGYFDHDQRPSS